MLANLVSEFFPCSHSAIEGERVALVSFTSTKHTQGHMRDGIAWPWNIFAQQEHLSHGLFFVLFLPPLTVPFHNRYERRSLRVQVT